MRSRSAMRAISSTAGAPSNSSPWRRFREVEIRDRHHRADEDHRRPPATSHPCAQQSSAMPASISSSHGAAAFADAVVKGMKAGVDEERDGAAVVGQDDRAEQEMAQATASSRGPRIRNP